jgi:hypothetical protein
MERRASVRAKRDSFKQEKGRRRSYEEPGVSMETDAATMGRGEFAAGKLDVFRLSGMMPAC